MERVFNIAGPCNSVKNYMLSATERLPDIASLIRKEQYFVIHAQHTAETGQVFEPGAIPITAADMHEAKEKIIRERGTHLDSLMERMKEPRVRRVSTATPRSSSRIVS